LNTRQKGVANVYLAAQDPGPSGLEKKKGGRPFSHRKAPSFIEKRNYPAVGKARAGQEGERGKILLPSQRAEPLSAKMEE